MSHPNVVATYQYEVLQASGYCGAPSGLSITDHSGERAFKLYLIQVGVATCSLLLARVWPRSGLAWVWPASPGVQVLDLDVP